MITNLLNKEIFESFLGLMESEMPPNMERLFLHNFGHILKIGEFSCYENGEKNMVAEYMFNNQNLIDYIENFQTKVHQENHESFLEILSEYFNF